MSIQEYIWTPSEQDLQKEKDWIANQIEVIGEKRIKDLIDSAVTARRNAYQPYSHYSVGAAILCQSGNIYTGCNAEAVSYTETDHAEKSAISRAVNEGEIEKYGRRFIRALAVSHLGESGPCGGCRQRIAEHADIAVIIDVSPEGDIKKITSLQILFPYAFTPSHLGIE